MACGVHTNSKEIQLSIIASIGGERMRPAVRRMSSRSPEGGDGGVPVAGVVTYSVCVCACVCVLAVCGRVVDLVVPLLRLCTTVKYLTGCAAGKSGWAARWRGGAGTNSTYIGLRMNIGRGLSLSVE